LIVSNANTAHKVTILPMAINKHSKKVYTDN